MLIYGQPMKAGYNLFIHIKIRLGYLLSLIFFVLLFLLACRQNKKGEIAIEWNNNQATGIIVPTALLEEVDSVSQLLHVRVQNNETAMLGNYSVRDGYVLFQPLVPLSRGLAYEIFFRNKLIGGIHVPIADAANAPKLIAVYPSADTLPENLLKIYVQFSAPMREGQALQHIHLLDERNDTLPDIFLDLQPELWNKERTVLTLWLDPGRIKRELIPNEQMGNPLQKGQYYTLSVSRNWKDAQGLPLRQEYKRKLIVGGRDSNPPQPQLWKIDLPKAGTVEPLRVNYQEPLDYYLLQETIRIVDEKENRIEGSMRIVNKEKGFEFVPAKPWRTGNYYIEIASYLEDLAGNNLARLFDRDIRNQPPKKEQAFVRKKFVIADQ